MKIQLHLKKPYRLIGLILIIFFLNGCKTCDCPSYSLIKKSKTLASVLTDNMHRARINY